MVTIITPSKDTDITVLLISQLWEFRQQVFVVDGTGDGEKRYGLWEVDVGSKEEADALLGLHAFTGHYTIVFTQISSFYQFFLFHICKLSLYSLFCCSAFTLEEQKFQSHIF